MPISTTYSALTTARSTLAAAIGSGEAAGDIARGRDILDEIDAAAAGYAKIAAGYNVSSAIYSAEQTAYTTALAAQAASLASETARLDLSARSAEQELTDAGVAGAWAPGTPSSPATFAVISLRASVAAVACRTQAALVPIGEALDRSVELITKASATTIPPPYQTQPGLPDTTWLDTLITKADRFREYLLNT